MRKSASPRSAALPACRSRAAEKAQRQNDQSDTADRRAAETAYSCLSGTVPRMSASIDRTERPIGKAEQTAPENNVRKPCRRPSAPYTPSFAGSAGPAGVVSPLDNPYSCFRSRCTSVLSGRSADGATTPFRGSSCTSCPIRRGRDRCGPPSFRRAPASVSTDPAVRPARRPASATPATY